MNMGWCLKHYNMAKDPAFLFYYQDFIVGTSDMSNEEVGAYIKCLCIQAAKGGITEKHMKNICNSHEVHNLIKSKFIFNDEIKLLENVRLKTEIEKRKLYSQSRANNRKGDKNKQNHMNNISKTYVKHMENENVIENETDLENKNGVETEKNIEQRKIDFFNQVGLQYSTQYSNQMLTEFCDYWAEHNHNGKKMRFEMEKVFDISRRLKTWSNNNYKSKQNGTTKSKLEQTEDALRAGHAYFDAKYAGKDV